MQNVSVASPSLLQTHSAFEVDLFATCVILKLSDGSLSLLLHGTMSMSMSMINGRAAFEEALYSNDTFDADNAESRRPLPGSTLIFV